MDLRAPKLLLRICSLAGALCAASALLAAAAGPAGAAQDGVNVDSGFLSGPAIAAQTEALIDKLHPGWVRVFLDWNDVEPSPGAVGLSEIGEYKQFFDALPAGTKVDVDVSGSPAWANGGSTNPATPPTSDASFAGFLNTVSNAWGSSVSAWEIWNEEDSTSNWTGTPAQYVSLLKAAYPAVKAADPGATVLLGGLGANDYPYLSSVYAAGGAGSFDGVAVHTDDACSITSPNAFAFNPGTQEINRWSFLGFTTVHSLMSANGDGAKPIFMTELGWSTTNSTCSSGSSSGKRAGGVSEKTQATYLNQAYNCLAQAQYSYVTAGMWFNLVDTATTNDFYNRYGLLSTALKPKPAFAAFEKVSADGGKLAVGCGNFAGPTLHLVSPRNGEQYSGPLPIVVTAKVNGGAKGDAIGQIAVQHDGKSILNFNKVDAHYANRTLTGHIDWQGARGLSAGPHTISVVATNANGVKSEITVTVIHDASTKKHK
jgi:hypothetical protein